MKSIRRVVRSAAVLSCFGLVAACGSSLKASPPSSGSEVAPASGVPASGAVAQEEADDEPRTLAEAEALLEKSRFELEQLARREPGRDKAEARAADAPPAKEASSCETACKAFSSLSRASDAICRLDTDGGKRCERARQIREDASRRVASCSCAK
jgi:hypothetical protein